MNNTKISRLAATSVVSTALLTGALAINFPEVEGNDTKAAANVFAGMAAGDTITGNTTGSSTTVAGAGSADYFKVGTAGAALGIYRYRMVATSAVVGHTLTIRGLNQTSSTAGGVTGTVDTTIQTSTTVTTPPRFVQWYGFGKSEDIYVRAAGTTSTTADYTLTLERSDVTAIDLGTYAPGTIVLNTVGQTGSTQTDTDLWVYDSNFDAIAGYGNDDESIAGGGTGTTLGSRLTRTYGVGTYYVAISNFQLANNMNSAPDDDFQTGTLLDFPNAIANSSTTTNLNLGMQITDSIGGIGNGTAVKAGQFDVAFYKFTVVPEPASMTALALGLGALAARRRRK